MNGREDQRAFYKNIFSLTFGGGGRGCDEGKGESVDLLYFIMNRATNPKNCWRTRTHKHM